MNMIFEWGYIQRCERILAYAHTCVKNLGVGRHLPALTSSLDIKASTRDDIVSWDLRIETRPTQLHIRSHRTYNDHLGIVSRWRIMTFFVLFSPSFVSVLPINVLRGYSTIRFGRDFT